MHSSSASLLILSNFTHDEYIHITPHSAQWDDLSFAARRMGRGGMWDFETHENEFALVVMGGTCQIRSNKGARTDVDRQLNIFAGMPYTLYLPPETRFTVEARSQHLDIAYGWCIAREAYPARFVKPAEVEIEIRGGGNATRQINKMIPTGSPCSRLVVVDVYTPSGTWSSYPPHKHDEHLVPQAGNFLEADLDGKDPRLPLVSMDME